MNELSGKGNVRFVPGGPAPEQGPPPGGCPYAQEPPSSKTGAPRDGGAL